MIEPPEGFVRPSRVVECVTQGFDNAPYNYPQWVERVWLPEDREKHDQHWAIWLEMLLCEIAEGGVYAWLPGDDPVEFAVSMFPTGNFPDCQYFNAVSDILRVNKAPATLFPEHPLAKILGKSKRQLIQDETTIAANYEGKIALMEQATALAFCRRAMRLPVLDEKQPGQKRSADEKRADFFDDLPDEVLFGENGNQFGPGAALDYLASKGQHVSHATAKRARDVARVQRRPGWSKSPR